MLIHGWVQRWDVFIEIVSYGDPDGYIWCICNLLDMALGSSICGASLCCDWVGSRGFDGKECSGIVYSGKSIFFFGLEPHCLR